MAQSKELVLESASHREFCWVVRSLAFEALEKEKYFEEIDCTG